MTECQPGLELSIPQQMIEAENLLSKTEVLIASVLDLDQALISACWSPSLVRYAPHLLMSQKKLSQEASTLLAQIRSLRSNLQQKEGKVIFTTSPKELRGFNFKELRCLQCRCGSSFFLGTTTRDIERRPEKS